MLKIKIEKRELLAAMEYSETGDTYYLNKKTGEIKSHITQDFLGFEWEDEFEENNDELFESNDYIHIPQIYPSEGYNIMLIFIEQLNESILKKELSKSIKMRHPFRNFKDFLLKHPIEREQWFLFYDNNLLEIAKNWLKTEGIDAEFF